MIRACVHFYGTVQGVGFRYTCLSLAKQLNLTGWVKNMPDGSVQAVVEGPRDKIEDLLLKLKGEFGSFIRKQEVEWLENKGEFSKFYIA